MELVDLREEEEIIWKIFSPDFPEGKEKLGQVRSDRSPQQPAGGTIRPDSGVRDWEALPRRASMTHV